MSQMLELSDSTYAALQAASAAAGTTPAEWIAARIPQHFQSQPEVSSDSGGTMADRFAGRLGRIHGSSEPFSQNCGERFTDYLEEKRRNGTL